jgi:hypothetical protein
VTESTTQPTQTIRFTQPFRECILVGCCYFLLLGVPPMVYRLLSFLLVSALAIPASNADAQCFQRRAKSPADCQCANRPACTNPQVTCPPLAVCLPQCTPSSAIYDPCGIPCPTIMHFTPGNPIPLPDPRTCEQICYDNFYGYPRLLGRCLALCYVPTVGSYPMQLSEAHCPPQVQVGSVRSRPYPAYPPQRSQRFRIFRCR